jgi:hypothetical protein
MGVIAALVLLAFLASCLAQCGPGLKQQDTGCVSINNEDVLRAMHFLTHPPSTVCRSPNVVAGVTVCEDKLPVQKSGECNIWSVITSHYCDDYGTLEFEKYWSEKGCNVHIFHFTAFFKGNTCSLKSGNPFTQYPRLSLDIIDIWGGKCYHCLYNFIKPKLVNIKSVNMLKIQQRSGKVDSDIFDGLQFTVLSDFLIHLPSLSSVIEQISVVVSINTNTLQDNVGREGEMAWNMYATQQFLRNYGAIAIRREEGPAATQPLQFKHVLEQAKIDPSIGYYYQTLVRIDDAAMVAANAAQFKDWKPLLPEPLRAIAPDYCKVPSIDDDKVMQTWIRKEMNVRCHPTRLWVPCVRDKTYDSFVPCPQELMNKLAEDYAASKGWCDFNSQSADIPHLLRVDEGAKKAFNKAPLGAVNGTKKVRLAFLFTLYTDAPLVERILKHLYSPDHYYLLHVDPIGAKPEFKRQMKALVARYDNAFLSDDVPIVYGASTATILLSKAMAWFVRYTSGWDFFVPITGSDYPLVPLPMIETMLSSLSPPMPMVMAWTAGTSTHIFRLKKTHPIFEYNPLLLQSISAVTDERGAILGQVPMEYRASNFGPPLLCENRQSFYHLDNRRNKTQSEPGIDDTMWLFAVDRFKNKGRAVATEDPNGNILPYDGVFRVWKKSDPATTGVYDRESVEYIVNSEEGKKYFHFFKHMLLGSEEHYYVSLLYNWERTRSFVQTLSAQSVWNTWELGWWDKSAGFQTHTHFLSVAEWDYIRGFSMRGMLFGRKFSSKKTAKLLDWIDGYILNNASTDAGRYWPGFYPTDITTPGKQWVAAHRANRDIAKKVKEMVAIYGAVVEETPIQGKQRIMRQREEAERMIMQEVMEGKGHWLTHSLTRTFSLTLTYSLTQSKRRSRTSTIFSRRATT